VGGKGWGGRIGEFLSSIHLYILSMILFTQSVHLKRNRGGRRKEDREKGALCEKKERKKGLKKVQTEPFSRHVNVLRRSYYSDLGFRQVGRNLGGEKGEKGKGKKRGEDKLTDWERKKDGEQSTGASRSAFPLRNPPLTQPRLARLGLYSVDVLEYKIGEEKRKKEKEDRGERILSLEKRGGGGGGGGKGSLT